MRIHRGLHVAKGTALFFFAASVHAQTGAAQKVRLEYVRPGGEAHGAGRVLVLVLVLASASAPASASASAPVSGSASAPATGEAASVDRVAA